jgi:hypothetical protein
VSRQPHFLVVLRQVRVALHSALLVQGSPFGFPGQQNEEKIMSVGSKLVRENGVTWSQAHCERACNERTKGRVSQLLVTV